MSRAALLRQQRCDSLSRQKRGLLLVCRTHCAPVAHHNHGFLLSRQKRCAPHSRRMSGAPLLFHLLTYAKTLRIAYCLSLSSFSTIRAVATLASPNPSPGCAPFQVCV
eukprot:3929422-Pleurochrysis_carterae.AAC.1